MILLLIAFMLPIANATTIRLVAVPMVTLTQLTVGATYTWTYFDNGDAAKLFSVEQYRVVGVKSKIITIEIWTRYAGKPGFTPSAKFVTDFKTCEQAFAGAYKSSVKLDMYPYENGQWSKTGYRVDGTAFEEKFNCNPKVYANPVQLYNTRFATAATPWGQVDLFQQFPRSTASQLLAFYFLSQPNLQGVAYEKMFNPNAPDYFVMRLTDWSAPH